MRLNLQASESFINEWQDCSGYVASPATADAMRPIPEEFAVAGSRFGVLVDRQIARVNRVRRGDRRRQPVAENHFAALPAGK